ncbi:MAG: hypothetical protein JXR63_11660 [Spirochaetales bacterium]|nr:hypothetical protein [Spirochaetales bacterium]
MKKKERIITGHDHGGDGFEIIDMLDLKQMINFSILNGDQFQKVINEKRVSTLELETKSYPHAKYDGIGAFSEFIKESGFTPPKLPLSKEQNAPSKIVRFFLFSKAMIVGRKIDLRDSKDWKNFDITAKINNEDKSINNIDFWFVLSREQTMKLEEKASMAGVSLNSYLLNKLNKTIFSHMSDENIPRRWMIPVNMRGPVQLDNQYGNHSSSLDLYQLPREAPLQTHKKIKKALKKKLHWKSWIFFTIIKTIGKDKLYQILTNPKNPAIRPYIGSFSNLGSWLIPGLEDGTMFFSQSVSKTVPFACGAVKVNGILGITWRKHPSLLISNEDFKRMLAVYKTILISEESNFYS